MGKIFWNLKLAIHKYLSILFLLMMNLLWGNGFFQANRFPRPAIESS